MEDKDVTQLSELLGLDKEVVEGSVKDGTLGERIQDWKSSRKIYASDDFEKFTSNLKTSTKDEYFNELVDLAKRGEMPTELYKPIKGSALEMFEKDLSKKYNVADYSNATDLVEKIVKSKSNATDNQQVQELEQKIVELQSANKDLLRAKEEADKTWETKYKSDNISRELSQAISGLPLDFSDKSDDEVDKVRNSTHTILRSVFDTTYETDIVDGKVIVKDKDGNVLKDKATLDPLGLDEVLTSLAGELNMKLTSPETGGQGGKSSKGKNGINSEEDFYAECERLGVQPTSAEGLSLWKQYKQNSK